MREKGEAAGQRAGDPAIKHIIPRSRRQVSYDVARTPFPFEEFGRTPRVLYAHASVRIRSTGRKIIFFDEARELRKYDEGRSRSPW